MVRVSNKQGVGFFDSTGKIAIPLHWDEAFPFGSFSNPNVTIAFKGDTKHVIDQAGKILPTKSDEVLYPLPRTNLIKVGDAERLV